MSADLRPSGLQSVGELPWGAHFCNFYGDRADLVGTLVPYFKAGLAANEQCLWVTSEPFRAEDARTALRAAVPDLDARLGDGQIEIIDHHDWYLRTGKSDPESVLAGWLEREERALQQGFAGLRLTGNTAWVERAGWDRFVDYEERVSSTFAGRKLIGLCSYCLGKCHPEDVLDVVRNHQFAVARRRGEWEVVESSSLKLAKTELTKLNVALEQRVHQRTAALEDALRVREEFLSVASHELKTPIASLELYVQGLVRGLERGTVSAAQVTDRLVKAHEQSRRLDKLIDNLLDVSRAGARQLPLQLEPVELGGLVRTVADRCAEELSRAGSKLTMETSPVRGLWDPTRLDRVVTNLVVNAARHAPGSNVEVSVRSEDGHALLTVRDDGPGIPLEDQPRIFDRFAQGTRRNSTGGFGLGLWIVKQIAEAHGGRVTVESQPGRGATFVVALPHSS